MLTVDHVRFHLLRARAEPETPGRDRELVLLMADALIEERRNTGAGTAQALRDRYGFTQAELDRHATQALDEATRRFVGGNLVDPVAAAA